jgi:hypothetical protein
VEREEERKRNEDWINKRNLKEIRVERKGRCMKGIKGGDNKIIVPATVLMGHAPVII